MVIGIAGIVAMGGDKLLAVIGWDRISERTLHIIALLGGFWGIIVGAFLFHHKTSKSSGLPSCSGQHSGQLCSSRLCSATAGFPAPRRQVQCEISSTCNPMASS